MNKYTNPYERIQLYNSWFANNEVLCLTEEFDCGVSIKFLSQISEIPLTIIRKDISTFFKWQSQLFTNEVLMDNSEELKIPNLLSFPEEILDNNPTLNEYYEDVEIGKFSKDFDDYILCGKLDEIPICFLKNASRKNTFKLWITPDEYEALKEYQVIKNSSVFYDKLFRIKDSYRYNHNYINLTEKLLSLNEAIKNNRCVEIFCKKKNKEEHNYIIKPIKIIYDITENQYAILATTGNDISTYRLEYIHAVYDNDSTIDSSKIEEKIKKIQPLVWGNSFTNKPIGPVKVRFYNEGKVWEKVKKEFENRDPSLLYEKDGYLYFESPEVYGGDNGVNFLRWIRSFGSSAIILSPINLRNRMIDSYKKRL